MIGNLTPDQDEADILSGFSLYKKTRDGKIRFSERPAAFKKQSLARVPPENYMVVEDE